MPKRPRLSTVSSIWRGARRAEHPSILRVVIIGVRCALLLGMLLWLTSVHTHSGPDWIAHLAHAQDSEDADAPATHTIQRGETLSEIAKLYGVSMDELMRLNGIDDADAIYFGQLLRLPLDSALRNSDSASADDTLGNPVLPAPSHTVKRGETLSEIAKQYGVRMADLMALNDINNSDAIYDGQTLRLPTAAFTASTPAANPVPPTAAPTATEAPATTAAPDSDSEGDGMNGDTDESVAETGPQNLSSTLNQTYTVRTGDTLNRIALRHGVDVDALRVLNRLDTAANGLSTGQILVLPATVQDTMVQEISAAHQEYTVQSGDSLSVIAAMHDVALAQLMAVNGMTDPDAIRIGESLIIPPPQPDTLNVEAPSSVGPAPSGFYYYTVGAGDTLSTLAVAFDSTVLAILEYNDLPNEETVYAGLEVRIPYGPPPIPRRRPRVPASGTQFLVSLSRQQCWVFHGDRVYRAWTCSTGYGQWTTRTGSFAVQTRMEMAQSSAYRLDMPYWLGIYDVGTFENGIHGLPVRWDTGKKIWTHLIGQPATFGCAMLADDDAAQLFELSYLGMPVHIVE